MDILIKNETQLKYIVTTNMQQRKAICHNTNQNKKHNMEVTQHT